jgi:mannan endo-1,4-beta-mannosidase
MSRARLALGASIAIVAAPALLMGAVALMHSGPGLSQSPSSSQSAPTVSAATMARIRNPAHAILGVFELGVPPAFARVHKFGRAVRHGPGLVVLFTGIGRPFPAAFAKMAHSHDTSLLIQINPGKIPLRAIAAGAYDGWLRGYAHQVAIFGHPVVIGFAHEMNGGWYPWGYKHQPATAFVAAWRHIVTVFRRQGANGVIWLWTVSHDIKYTSPLRPYWPGSHYVDWVGIDGYYYHRSDTFSNVFGRKLKQIRRITHDPVLLSEVGIGQIAGQAHKIPGLIAGIAGHHLVGLVWFDVAQHGGVFHQDWRLEGHPTALAAFRRGLDQLLTHHR